MRWWRCWNRPKRRPSATGGTGGSATAPSSRCCAAAGWRAPRSRSPSQGPDSTLLHHALGLLRPGDILVVDRLGDVRHACWGGGVTVAAKASGAKAGVVDGPCTDMEEIEASDFPMWCRGMAPITTRIYDLGGLLNHPVCIGGAVVMPGDAILCDDTGVLVLPPGEAEAEARKAIATQANGLKNQASVARGTKLGEISGASAKVLAAS